MIEYTLERKQRKNITICVNEGQVVVRAPLCCSQVHIENFIHQKESWILQKQSEWLELQKSKQSFVDNFGYGSKITIRGNELCVTPINKAIAEIDDVSLYIPAGLDNAQARDACIKACYHIASKHLPSRVEFFAKQMNVVPKSIKINTARSRWGSCSGCKRLNFSWRLICGSDDVIDYVVVHELAHILQMNHSDKFWDIIATVMPDYKKHICELRKLHCKLVSEGWV